MTIDKKFWDGTRWQGHAAFDTISHTHVSCYFPADGFETCDIMAVECRDGRWYVEDNWGDGVTGAWNPFETSDAGPQFFDTEDAATRHAVSLVAKVSGVPEQELLDQYLQD